MPDFSTRKGTAIGWADETWNPLAAFDKETGKRGWFCVKSTPGCAACYASVLNVQRGTGHDYTRRHLDAIDFRLVNLDQPARWRAPRLVFVNSMTDLFLPEVHDETIARVFRAMLDADRHVYLLLTKHAERMRAFMRRIRPVDVHGDGSFIGAWLDGDGGRARRSPALGDWVDFPWRNIWLGVSVEDQPRAARLEVLRSTPAGGRFASFEPLLGHVDVAGRVEPPLIETGILSNRPPASGGLDWAIVGGESAARWQDARPFRLDAARALVRQLEARDIPVQFKQLGSNPVGEGGAPYTFPAGTQRHRGNADRRAFPRDLDRQEFPPFFAEWLGHLSRPQGSTGDLFTRAS